MPVAVVYGQAMPDGPIVREPTPEQDRVRPIPLVGVAVGSLVAGFLVVWALGQSAAEAPRESEATRQRARPGRTSERQTPSESPGTPRDEAATPTGEPTPQAAPAQAVQPAAEAPAEAIPTTSPPLQPAPAPAAPAGVTLGQAFYFRCWEAGHDEPVDGECDKLPMLEERVREQLGEIATCASGSSGTLSIGLEVQFASKRTRWWSGRSTTITPVEPLIQCVRTRLADTNLEGIEHRYQKYTLFLPVGLP